MARPQKYGEKTVVIRVPVRLVPEILKFINDKLKEIESHGN